MPYGLIQRLKLDPDLLGVKKELEQWHEGTFSRARLGMTNDWISYSILKKEDEP
jgi:hypothetical protein